jgi:hypothetical protein
MYDVHVKGRVAFLTIGFSVLGIVLVLLGSLVQVPYTTLETFNNYPYKSPVTWADEVLSLRPQEFRGYELDGLNENKSLVYVNVKKSTGPFVFTITGYIGWGFNGSEVVALYNIWPIEPPNSPFEYFWTQPAFGTWDFVFENPYDTTVNITVKILAYNYNTEWKEEVTHYHSPLDESFAYSGITLIIVAIAPIAYQLYKTRKEMPKKPWWRDKAETEKTREAEEKGKLK